MHVWVTHDFSSEIHYKAGQLPYMRQSIRWMGDFSHQAIWEMHSRLVNKIRSIYLLCDTCKNQMQIYPSIILCSSKYPPRDNCVILMAIPISHEALILICEKQTEVCEGLAGNLKGHSKLKFQNIRCTRGNELWKMWTGMILYSPLSFHWKWIKSHPQKNVSIFL